MMSYFIRFLLLMIGVALATLGLLYWQNQGFTFEGLLLYDNDWRPHPLHILVLGIAMVPPAMWEVFVLDVRRARTSADEETHDQTPGAGSGA